MARGVNKAIIVGNLGKDPETRYSAGGLAVTTASLAVNEQWKDKQTGEQKEKTEWINIKFFGRLAEIAGEYLKKGAQVYVEGKIRTEEYEKDGAKRYFTCVVAEEMQMLGSRPGGEGQQQPRQQSSAPAQNRQSQAPAQNRPAQQPQRAAQPTQTVAFEDDDTIPF